MSFIYLIRHAQAGARDNYDVLSELGRQQAGLLGEYLSRLGIELAAVYAGGMQRQRLTAEIACEVMASRGVAVPDVTTDERWNEFSLISVYRAIANRMMEDSPEFTRDYREMQDAIRRDPHTTGGATGRCDGAVIRAWMEARYDDYKGEAWSAFRERIEACGSRLFTDGSPNKAIAVFTSATPVAILAAAALELSDEKLLSILGVIYNSGITILRSREDGLRLFSFNSTPHLEPSQRTLR
ncbi:MAG TPA: histidine phosphatase family protein [Blastocatellia bacterium]|nr:histidine phosphatase family protein [Blastocatellia bacterium]